MFRNSIVAAAALAVGCALTACGSSTEPSPAPRESARQQLPRARCGVDLASPVVRDAIARLPVEPVTATPWSADPATLAGNFDPCVTLSTAIVTIQGATGSSPQHALLFHRGEYVGTATEKAYGFTTLAASASTDDTVVLDYKTPGSCNACDDGAHTQVGFHWDGQRVVMNGTPPG
ncbi:LppP/LprE family lipoprotein [Nocardia wallacei]|uniref:LppP/LprE family lipoprotein n=1 Tax=Nocardia wallacei TaxID=480035 RepID=UPI0024569D12|nr:LppP/LprE family lipoprotein [Nocardia wallacei]